MLLFLFGFFIVLLGVYILISLIQLAFMILCWIILAILQEIHKKENNN